MDYSEMRQRIAALREKEREILVQPHGDEDGSEAHIELIIELENLQWEYRKYLRERGDIQ